ncbi:hypothetical protein, partial [Escherichia coli]|uniref:hypothetical protein n=1 Tax=Escherichia coli TaxID=562 RepID=UPI001BC84E08
VGCALFVVVCVLFRLTARSVGWVTFRWCCAGRERGVVVVWGDSPGRAQGLFAVVAGLVPVSRAMLILA